MCKRKKEPFPLEVALLLWSGVRVWFMVSVLKTDVRERTVGSNPTLTAYLKNLILKF